MDCKNCNSHMICLSQKKLLDRSKDLWYTLYVWYCQGCGNRREERVYD